MDRYKSFTTIFKLCETISGFICLGLIGYYGTHVADISLGGFVGNNQHTFFLLTSCTFTVTVLLLLISAFFSKTTDTFFELLFHLFATLFFFSASVALLADVTKNMKLISHTNDYKARIAAGGIGIITSGLYLGGSIFTFLMHRSAS